MPSWRAARAFLLAAISLNLPARAEPALPSYREEVVVAAWNELDAAITASCRWNKGLEGIGAPLTCDADRLDAVIAQAEAFTSHVVNDGRIHYLMGLAQRHRGELQAAERSLRTSTQLAPTRVEAWFDLGELLSRRRDWEGARTAFTQVVALLPEGKRAWPGWFQLAQVAGHRGDAEELDRALREALRHGFTFQIVMGNEGWATFLADPVLRPGLERLIRVYADPEVAGALLGAERATPARP